MIFVTVGTHEQGFDRLIKAIDELVRDGKITEDVFMQIGYSTYEPKYTKWDKVIGYDIMKKYMNEADVVITHGGPSTYMQIIQLGKIPVVVPRLVQFNEHVNDHQLWVTKQVMDKGYPLIICENIDDILLDIIKSKHMDNLSEISNNDEFIKKFVLEVGELGG
ncbi:multidrug MFS transporter [Lactococcus piscium]|uniref:glycosyltransferase n=1 Tax=Pseudolactococcus carnosus TaxID=2749961 RepID=UPI001FBA57CC|nr:glycosyltransferase [Lactococcus carnosus]MCJ1991695.1 multidrug MFS transporter [Lactococcus carnosus]